MQAAVVILPRDRPLRQAESRSGVPRGSRCAGAPRERRRLLSRHDIRLTPDDEQTTFVRDHRKCALATLDPNGFPHVAAMDFFFQDGAYYMTSYGKTQKVLNIRRNPKVALMINDGDSYEELRGIMIRGRCEIIDDPEAVRAILAFRSHAQSSRPSASGAMASPQARGAEDRAGEDHHLGSSKADGRVLRPRGATSSAVAEISWLFSSGRGVNRT